MSTDTELAFASITQIAALFRKRKVSPVEVTRLMLKRIERLNPQLNAYITVCAEQALAQAKQAEAELLGRRGKKRDRGPLHGIPISLKDNICTKGVKTTAGSRILRDYVPMRDAAIVKQLCEAGAVILGKTNMHEFAYGVTSNNPHFGPVHNPWDLDRIPGGSSGGSAAAVAAGLCYGSIGTDTGGSIRIPAALCGVVGLKPTFGVVNVDGVVPLSPRLDCIGPLVRSVRDAALIAEPLIARSKAQPPLRRATRAGKRKIRPKIRMGLPRDFFFKIVSVDVQYAFNQALRLLERSGATFVEVPVPLLHETEDAGNQIAWAEATYYHQQAGWFPAHAADYGEDVRKRIELGTKVAATAYLQALEMRALFIQQLHMALHDANVDALAFPTTPIAAPLIGEETTVVSGEKHPTRALLLRLNRPANLAGVPAISVPCGFTNEGLPVALQLMGAVGDESVLLQAAAAFEKVRPGLPKFPNLA
ncbi:MAG TPA: amidase [Candidatus Dormibacteraeota bacterium]|nr:amidase [Candidatus Dormibacteraeota bacterium]